MVFSATCRRAHSVMHTASGTDIAYGAAAMRESGLVRNVISLLQSLTVAGSIPLSSYAYAMPHLILKLSTVLRIHDTIVGTEGASFRSTFSDMACLVLKLPTSFRY